TGGDDPQTQLGATFEPVRFESTDGIPLAGWWIPAAASPPPRVAAPTPAAEDPTADGPAADTGPDPEWGRRTVILCHGLGAGKGNQLALARDLVPNGYNVLAFDFRAHGDSGGQLASFGDLERQDVLGAVRWVRANRQGQSRRLFGLGVSMGGAALLAAAGDQSDDGRAIDAVAVFSTYDTFTALADAMLDRHFVPPFGWLAKRVGVPLASAHVGADLRAFNPAAAANRIAPRPLMVVHGRGDALIPFDAAVRLYDGASQPKVRLWVGEKNDDTGEYVIRENPKYALDPAKPGAGKTFQPPRGLPADHNNLLYYDAAVKAVRLFFEAARPAL
ncbi:MAG: peptidase family, catalytic domain protein, partial [Phycisphaerales bacterium]|nr:peptidase family, catalytic domain protein [Phycisphaerales bacterium]